MTRLTARCSLSAKREKLFNFFFWTGAWKKVFQSLFVEEFTSRSRKQRHSITAHLILFSQQFSHWRLSEVCPLKLSIEISPLRSASGSQASLQFPDSIYRLRFGSQWSNFNWWNLKTQCNLSFEIRNPVKISKLLVLLNSVSTAVSQNISLCHSVTVTPLLTAC